MYKLQKKEGELTVPIFKRCSFCGKRIPEGQECSCKQNSKRYKEYDKSRNDDKQFKFENTWAWHKRRNEVMKKYGGIDLYSYFRFGVIEKAEVVHHIIPVKENYDLRFEYCNLIPLTEANHRRIHIIMICSKTEKEKIIKQLQQIISTWRGE